MPDILPKVGHPRLSLMGASSVRVALCAAKRVIACWPTGPKLGHCASLCDGVGRYWRTGTHCVALPARPGTAQGRLGSAGGFCRSVSPCRLWAAGLLLRRNHMTGAVACPCGGELNHVT